MSSQYKVNITPGSPPLLWSNLNDAFNQINDNFTIISTLVQNNGISLTDFSNFNSDIVPTADNTIKLGDTGKNWKAVHIADQSLVPGSENNGLWLGSAQITSSGGSITLPASTTLGGQLIIDPAKTYFKFVNVDSGSPITAGQFNDTLNFTSGTAIQLVANPTSKTVTVNNTGVTQLAGGTGITVNHATGNVTITNSGVTQITAGEGITINNTTGNVTITNSGIRGINVVSGLSVSVDPNTRIATLNNSSPASGLFTFRSFSVPGQSLITSISSTDTLTLYQGYGIKMTTNTNQRAITVSLDQKVDITGSVFADNSSLLVDGVMGRLVGPLYADSFGTHTGNVVGNISGIAPAGNLSGDTLASNVVTSSLTAVGTLTNLAVANVGTAKNFVSSLAVTTSAGTTTTLTVNSSQEQTITGSTTQRFVLPNATTLSVGHSFTFNNNNTAGNVSVYLNDNTTLLVTITPGAAKEISLYANGTVNGSWDIHGYLPSNAGWGTAYFNTTSTTFDVLASPTTVNLGAAATALTFGADGSGTTTVRNTTVTKAIKKAYTPIAGATGTVTHDYSLSDVWVHTNIVTNFNADFTNMNLADGQYTVATLVLVQGATGRIPNAVLINGSNTGVTLYWAGGSPPTGNANKRDIVTFTFYNVGGAIGVHGKLETFG